MQKLTNPPGLIVRRNLKKQVDQIWLGARQRVKIKFISSKRMSKPWMSREILQLVKTKSRHFKLYENNEIGYPQYRSYRNYVKSTIRLFFIIGISLT